MIQVLKSKIHQACVTQALLEYEGSFGIDKELMKKVGIKNFEAVDVYNITNGQRLRTYAIPLPEGSKRIESNGAAAHLIRKGDQVIIAAYAMIAESDFVEFKGPKIAILDGPENQIKKLYQPDILKADGSKSLFEFDLL